MYSAGNGTAAPAPPRSYPEQIRSSIPLILFLFDNFVIVIEDTSCALSYEMQTFLMLTSMSINFDRAKWMKKVSDIMNFIL